MLTLAQGVLESQARRRKVSRWAISYRLRYWDIETQAFTFTGAFTEIPRGDVAMLGITRDALDRGDVNEFKSSNVTIELRNRLNEWSFQNPGGKFRADATARLGYEQQLMEFKIEAFYELEDGTESAAIILFVGHASAWDFYPARGVVAITLESKHVLLRRSNAETVNNSFVDQLLIATADPLVFVTSQVGIGRVTAVRISGIPQRLGADVTVSDLNVHDQPAKLTFLGPPASTPRADYLQWKRDQKIEQLVKDIGVVAGIPLSQQLVEPVVYVNRVLNTKTFTSQVDWEGGLTLRNLDTSSTPGDISRLWHRIDDFGDGDFTNNPSWTIRRDGGSISVVSGALRLFCNTNIGASATLTSISVPSSKSTGTWRFIMDASGAPATAAHGPHIFFLMSDATPNSFGFPTGNGYYLEVTFSQARLLRISGGSATVLVTAAGDFRSVREWRITRDGSGLTKVFHSTPGVEILSTTDNLFTTAGAFVLATLGTSSSPSTVDYDDIYWSNVLSGVNAFSSLDPLWESQPIDGTVNLAEFLTATNLANMPSGTSIKIETASSDASGGPYDPYIQVDSVGRILSLNRRFLKLQLTILGGSSFPDFVGASVSVSSVLFTTSTTTIRMANLLGMTGFDAIQNLGEIANYEWGFTREGKLFFRPRGDSTTVQYTIRLKNLQAPHITRVSDGIDRVFNEVRGIYGTHERLVNPTTQNDSRPTSVDRFGVRRLNIGGGQILVDPDADIATGLTISYYDRFKLPRRRFELVIDMAPQLELGDVLLLQVADALPNPPWHIGDTSRWIGNTAIHLFGHEQQSAYDVKARILSVGHDPNIGANLSRLELEEIP